MTTVACDGRMMAGDGMVTDDNIVCSLDTEKVVRLRDGRIAGFCGDAFSYRLFAEWLDNGCEGDPPKSIDGLGCIVLSPDGTLTSYDEHGRTFVEHDKWAIGSGQRFALAAMDLGKSAGEAVVYACTRDVFSGGIITSLELEPQIRAVA